MSQRFLDHLAEFVTGRRGLVLALVGVFAVAAAAAVPSIEMDPSPKTLVAGYGNQAQATELLVESFGNTDHVVVVLAEADDVFDPGVLQYVRDVSRRLEAEPLVERVASITETPLALRGLESGDDEPLSLDALEEDDDLLGPELTPELLEALEGIIAAEPDRFPMGLSSISESAAEVDVFRLGEIDPESAAELSGHVEQLPLLSGRLVGRPDDDGHRRIAAVVAMLGPEVDDHDMLEEAAARIDLALDAVTVPQGVSVSVAGLPHLWVQIVESMESDQVVLVPLTLLVCMIFLWASFRWLPATLLPIVAVAVTALLAVGAMAAVGEPLNVLNNIVPPLLIIIGVSDSIHLIGRYREELGAGHSPRSAIKRTVRAMAVACLLTSVTTAVGLASLVVAQTDTLQRFGVSAAVGVLIAYAVTILFLPATLLYFDPPRAFFAQAGERASRRQDLVGQAVEGLTAWIIRRPWTVLAVSAVVSAVALGAALQVEVDTRLRDQFDEEDPIYQSTVLMDEQLDGVRPLEILVQVPPSSPDLAEPDFLNFLEETASWAEERDAVLRASTVAEYLHEAWFLTTGFESAREQPFASRAQIEGLLTLTEQEALDDDSSEAEASSPAATMLSDDRRLARLEIRVADVGAQATMRLIDEAEERLSAGLAEIRPDAEIYFTGDAFTGSVPTDSVARDMLTSLGVAVVLIFFLLSVLFRSVRLGLLAIPSNAIPLLLAIAWMVVRGIPLNIATAIIFSISFGLAVDGTIHVLARFREERRDGKDLDSALLSSARGTGRAIAVSCAVLMFGFAVFLFSGFVPVRYFGELIAITVASCLGATLVVQPALLKVGVRDDPRSPPSGDAA